MAPLANIMSAQRLIERTWAAGGGNRWLGGCRCRPAGACGSRGCPCEACTAASAGDGRTHASVTGVGRPLTPPLQHGKNDNRPCRVYSRAYRKKATSCLLSHGTYCGHSGSRKLGLRRRRAAQGAALARHCSPNQCENCKAAVSTTSTEHCLAPPAGGTGTSTGAWLGTEAPRHMGKAPEAGTAWRPASRAAPHHLPDSTQGTALCPRRATHTHIHTHTRSLA